MLVEALIWKDKMETAYLRTGEHICEQAFNNGFCWVCGKKMKKEPNVDGKALFEKEVKNEITK